ncbi:NACHT and ankyrin domain-containing protein [Plectosphaerella plurivora]|uniref:NACHT and ankyrin domain-containing protein n=1 Tax=Plectosphaerella plurivora TaxID=936078 RepID=A0A9P8VAJ0_9PEZI|nr:NACHT and ankyrin domain-containing protein [Plectosphaerella plurivora]
MGKTMMSLFLLDKFETSDSLRGGQDGVLLFYFVDNRNERRNTAVSILRGLIHALLQHRPALMNHLLPDFEIQKEALFAKTSLEALWRIFTTMLRDPAAGTVRCLIDGLDECQEDDLVRLLRKITTFFEQQQRGVGPAPARLKLILVSREAPACIADNLSNYPRIDVSAATARTRVTKAAVEGFRRAGSSTSAGTDKRFADLVRLAVEKNKASQQVQEASKEPKDNRISPQPATHDISGGLSVSKPGPYVPPNDNGQNVASQQAEADEYTFDPPVDDDSEEVSEARVDGKHPATVPATVQQVQTEGPPVYVVQSEVKTEEKAQPVEEVHEMYQGSLEHYIDARVSQLAEEMGYNESVSTLIGTGLRSRGDGTFLWVDLAVDEIKRHPVDQVEDVVDQLLPGLDNMYCNTLHRITPEFVPLAAALLRWAVTARRPMYVAELVEALTLEGFASTNPREMIEKGIEVCGSLLALKEGTKSTDATVQPSHLSVKDFLTAPNGPILSDAHLSRFHVDTAKVDGEIAALCIRYLEGGCLKAGRVSDDGAERLAQFPLLVYAIESWPDHLRLASHPEVDLNSPFFQHGSTIRKEWWSTYYTWKSGRSVYWVPRGFNLLHLAAYANITPIAQALEDVGALYSRIDDTDSYGSSALNLAAGEGNLEMFAFLHSRGAKLETPDYEDVFGTACKKGQAKIVNYMLDAGYDVNAVVEPTNKEAFKMIAKVPRWLHGVADEYKKLENDHWSMMFNDLGASTTPIFDACMFGHTSVVELLLRRGANLKHATSSNWTALHVAAWTGQLECVKLFLQYGGDPEQQTDSGLNALHCTASRGKTAVATFLLEHGVQVDARTPRERTALHFAAVHGSAEMIQVLAGAGADIEARSYKGETPLHVAARREKTEAVQALLALGARVDAIEQEGKTPLAALREIRFKTDNQKAIVRILEKAEAGRPQSSTLSAPSFSYTPPPLGGGTSVVSSGASSPVKKRRSFMSLSGMVEKAESLYLR